MTELVSVNAAGTGGGNGNSLHPIISSNGQFIAFGSTAEDLVPDDTNGLSDIFVRDRLAGTTALVSVGALGASRYPVMTPDGRWIAFESTGAVAGYGTDVFMHDRQAGRTFRVNVDAQTTDFTRSEAPSLSADGQRIAFASTAGVLEAKPGSAGEVYVRDLSTSATIWVSSDAYSNRLGQTIRSFGPVLSATGRFVAFKAADTSTNLYFHDLQTGLTRLVSSAVPAEGFPEMTPNGRFVAFESDRNVFIWDSEGGQAELVSADVAGKNPASGVSYRPKMTPDAARILFLSDAPNLTTNAASGQAQLYVRDRSASTTRLVSVTTEGEPSSSLNGAYPVISEEGNYVAFESEDSRLVPGDENADSDVFVRDLQTETTALVSARLPELPSRTAPGFLTISRNCMSRDGRYLVFAAAGPA